MNYKIIALAAIITGFASCAEKDSNLPKPAKPYISVVRSEDEDKRVIIRTFTTDGVIIADVNISIGNGIETFLGQTNATGQCEFTIDTVSTWIATLEHENFNTIQTPVSNDTTVFMQHK
jgi:hypothetical protein